MLFHLVPVYGWGWFTDDNASVDVPAPFDLEAEIIEGGTPPKILLGQLSLAGHTLSGLWIHLSLRTTGSCIAYNLRAFRDRPPSPSTWSGKPVLDGFVELPG